MSENLEFTISLIVNTPDREIAQKVADKAQLLMDNYGADFFLRAVDFMEKNQSLVGFATSLVNKS